MLIGGGIVLHLCLNSMFFIASKSIAHHPLNIWEKIDKKSEKKFKIQKDVIKTIHQSGLKTCESNDGSQS